MIDLFNTFATMMRAPKTQRGTQDSTLKIFASTFTNLDKVLEPAEISRVACQFVASLPFRSDQQYVKKHVFDFD